MKKFLKDNKGITLIALVITIVIMLILAAVAIRLTLGENGIISRSKYAKESYQNAQEEEKQKISVDIIDELIDAKLKKIDGVDSVTLAVDDTIASSKLKVIATVQTSKEVNIQSYEYFIYKGDQLVTKKNTTENNCTLEGLEAGQEYNIIVAIYNDQSNANKSEVLTYTKKALWDKYEYDAVGDYTYSCTKTDVSKNLDRLRDYWCFCDSLEDDFDSNTGKWTYDTEDNYGDTTKCQNIPAGSIYIDSYNRNWGSSSNYHSSSTVYVIKSWVRWSGSYTVEYLCDQYQSSGTTTYTPKGDSLGVVSDTNPNKYPDDGYQSNYYYIKKQ